MESYYNDVQASLFWFVKQFRDEVSNTSPNMRSFKFDAHSEENKLPATDIIGPAGFSLVDNGGLVTVTNQFLVSTYEDKNLFRLDELIGALYPKLIPGKTFDLVHYKTGHRLGQFTVADGTTVFHIERASNRPIKAIAVELKLDRASTLPPMAHWDALSSWDSSFLWN